MAVVRRVEVKLQMRGVLGWERRDRGKVRSIERVTSGGAVETAAVVVADTIELRVVAGLDSGRSMVSVAVGFAVSSTFLLSPRPIIESLLTSPERPDLTASTRGTVGWLAIMSSAILDGG